MAKIEPVEGKYIHITVQDIEYRVYYEESGKGGIPLICQHSSGCEGTEWRHLLNDPDVTAKYHVIVPDLPYHGKSLPPESEEWWKQEYKLTRSFFIDFHLELIRALGLERPVYIGNATGGTLAPYLALYHPDKYRAVIGLEASLGGGTSTLDIFYHPYIGNDLRRANAMYFCAPTSPEKYRRLVSWCAMLTAPPVCQGDMYFGFCDHDLHGLADKIDTSKCAVYLLTGEYDPASSVEDSMELANQIKGAKFFEMKGISHSGIAENPPVVKSYLMPVLNEIFENSGN